MSKMTIRLHESARGAEILTMLKYKGYTLAEEDLWLDKDELVCYKEFSTGMTAPDTVTVLVKYYGKEGELSVEVVASSYDRGTANGGMTKDLYYTFLQGEFQKVSRLQAEDYVDNAERAAKMYISALKDIRGV